MQEPQGTWVWSLGWEGPLEEKMTTHSSILAWRIRIPWTEEPGGLQSMGLQSQIGLKWLSKQLVHFTDVGLFITLLYYPFYIIRLFSNSPPLLYVDIGNLYCFFSIPHKSGYTFIYCIDFFQRYSFWFLLFVSVCFNLFLLLPSNLSLCCLLCD